MLRIVPLLCLISISQILAFDLKPFSKLVPSKAIFPICEYDKKRGDETGIFFIDYKEKEITHTFLIRRGIDPSFCKELERETLKLKRKNFSLKLSGSSGIYYPEEKNISWFWGSLKSKRKCVSYFVHECE
jgi:hypothetical protein